MLPNVSEPVPASLLSLLAGLAPLFTAPSFRTFCGLACGFLTRPGKPTVCGMLEGAGLSRLWPPSSAASSSPPDFTYLAPATQHARKSAPSAWPGQTQPHNRESRDIMKCTKFPDAVFASGNFALG